MVSINTYSSACRSNFWILSNRFILPSSAGWAHGPESQYCFISSCNFRPRDSALAFNKLLKNWSLFPDISVDIVILEIFASGMQQQVANWLLISFVALGMELLVIDVAIAHSLQSRPSNINVEQPNDAQSIAHQQLPSHQLQLQADYCRAVLRSVRCLST